MQYTTKTGQKTCHGCSLAYNSKFAVWDKKLLCESCFDNETDKAFDEFVQLDNVLVRTRIQPQIRQELSKNGWSSVILCHVLEASNYDAISSYDDNMYKICQLIKNGCSCSTCQRASSNFESFLSESYTPILFLSHVSKWEPEKIQLFYKWFC
jgi:hypothetical protein